MTEVSAASDASKRPTWKDRLEPFGHLFVNLDDQIKSMCCALDDDALQALVDATAQVSTTNVWCYSYDAAPFVKRLATREQQKRRLADADAQGEPDV